jgi:hypothetical protein
MAAKVLKATLPRISKLCDGRLAVDVEPDICILLKQDGGRLLIDVEDGVRLVYWHGEDDVCHVVIERERQEVV